VITISELNRKKIARPIECVGCNWSSRSAVRRAPDGPQVNAERARSHKFEGEAGMTFTPAFMSRIADGLEIAGGAAVIVLSQDPAAESGPPLPRMPRARPRTPLDLRVIVPNVKRTVARQRRQNQDWLQNSSIPAD
jgi:hypothetical protein